jgi:hypothetical protein
MTLPRIRMTVRVPERLLAMLLLGSGFVILRTSDSLAEYRYISNDPYTVQRDLIRDLQSQRLDVRNIDRRTIEGINQRFFGSPTPELLNALGPLAQICLSFAVQYPNGRRFSFRTVHQNGCGDWVVTVTVSPELVQGLAFLPMPKQPNTNECGPPAVLPLAPAGGESYILPSRVECKDLSTAIRPASPDEERRACAQWPAMCDKGKKP